MVTGRHLPRRLFLKGLGAAIALPALDAMTPAFAAPASRTSPLRLAFTYVPNGVTLPAWTPADTGPGFTCSGILAPLAPYRDDTLVLTGLAHKNAYALGDGPGDHARAAAAYLTGVHARKTAGADIQNGISVDQIAAANIGNDSRFRSIELGCDDSRSVGNCDSGYSCAYTNSVSWRSPTSPMPPETNPRLAFERLFGAFDAGLDPETRARRMFYRRSILDTVSERTRALVVDLGPSDRRKVDEYLSSIREIERRIELAEQDMRDLPPGLEAPTGVPVLFADYVKLMFDLQVVAFQADLTRVSTMMMGREGSIRTYPEIGVPDPHHPLTHHGGKADWIERVTLINTHHMELFAYFIQQLKSTADGDGTLLDRCMVVYGSGIADGDKHSHENLPVLLIGRGGGSLTPGRHVVYPDGTPMTNLYLTLLDRLGVREETLGDSTGHIE
ncbi:MAG TPA: DUF1552 domain-containing protein, partial [Vicinamibacterales bacterium]|nr:DUF1552 domain-containing protein [Vicinamibacterales bacterium]